ncbi:MAG TPA: DUF5103 domain-containing protein [Prolixibacteraceae bacterium]|nr:DUF5103 domain-containing protein [Prolixibacteraceae bacterium]
MYRETSLFFILLNIILTLNSRASENADPFYYENTVYREEIKSVQLYREGNELSNPVIELGSDAKLVLKFDELAEDAKNYFYTIIHCDASWNESYIQQSEYLNGFADNPLTDFAMSFNTTVKFVNYQLLIPNDECTPRYSGNYVLVIFEDNNRENLVLIQRFYIVEPLVRIEGLVKKATFDPFNGENQEVDFKIVNDQLNLLNPRKDIKVVLMQNRRSDNAIVDLKPNFIRDNVLDYDYSKENVFPGGNEFRYFDIRTKRYNGENVDNIKFIRPYYHVTLRPDAVRGNKKYSGYKEMNGNFVIESQDRVTDFDTECDYMFVHFYLPMESRLVGGSVNVFGALTGWNANKTNEMKWNFGLAGYELTLLLKQGYYNYQYVYVPEGSRKVDSVNLEGSFFITENEYQIFAYYRDQAGRYDRLVGFVTLNSAVN